jgi:phenylacetic acid degradation operon negative regulatory protein
VTGANTKGSGPNGAASIIEEFADRSDISARSTLVTVFGDTIAPAGGAIWLSDLFELLAPFGFSERLLRTSMSRLTASGWCEASREGRRSRYALTPDAAAETAEADRRIYTMPDPAWDGDWTLVLVEGDPEPNLRWNGFARLGSGLWGLPHDEAGHYLRIVKRLRLDDRYPTATARFADVGRLIDGGRLTSGFELDELIAGYDSFLKRYRPLRQQPLARLGPADAFAVRTMIVHDLRRLRLRDPDLPSALLPDPWSGRQAFEVASAIYRHVEAQAWTWAGHAAKLAIVDHDQRVAARFVEPDGSSETSSFQESGN